MNDREVLERAVASLGCMVPPAFPQPMEIEFTPPTWREVPRINIPAFLISRVIREMRRRIGLEPGVVLARLEQRGELLDGLSARTRIQGYEQRLLHWLLEAPNSGPDTIECCPRNLEDDQLHQAFVRAFLTGKQEPVHAAGKDPQEIHPIADPATPKDSADAQMISSQGVR